MPCPVDLSSAGNWLPEGLERIQLLLEAGASPSVTNCHGQTLLHLAMTHGVGPGRQHIGKSATATAKGAVSTGRGSLTDLLQLLTHHGAHLLDEQDHHGRTALHIAAGLPLRWVT